MLRKTWPKHPPEHVFTSAFRCGCRKRVERLVKQEQMQPLGFFLVEAICKAHLVLVLRPRRGGFTLREEVVEFIDYDGGVIGGRGA